MIKVTILDKGNRNSVIVDENTTVRQVLEDNGVDYASGQTGIDGATLGVGQFDKTFAELGITDKCFLTNVVKHDNAASVKIVGDTAFVESGITLQDIQKVEKAAPRALCLFETEDGKKEMVFRVGVGSGNGSVNSCGVSFGTGTTANGHALVKIALPEEVDNKVAYVADKVGVALTMLGRVESQIPAAIAEIDAQNELILSKITVL